MAIDTRLQIGLAAAATALLGGVVIGVLELRKIDTVVLPDGTECATHVAIDWPGPVPANAQCKTSEIVGPSEAWLALGLCPDGRYAVARICAAPFDGELDANAVTSLPAGVSVTTDDVDVATPYASGPQLEVWDIRHPDASNLFACACSTGSDCEHLTRDIDDPQESWRPAPKAITFEPGRWRGDGCKKKQCRESYTRACPGESMHASCRRE